MHAAGQDSSDGDRIAGLLRQAGIDAETIAGLRRQAVADRASIAQLQSEGRGDHEQIIGLEAQAVVDHEIIAAMAEQGLLDKVENQNLHDALASSRRIGAAMGILMATQQVDEQGAFALLRTVSQNTHRKLRDVAEALLYTGALDS